MYVMGLRVSDYNTRNYRVDINSSWVTVQDADGNILVKRHADEGPWYDPAHRVVVDAIRELESAIFKLVDAENRG